MALAVASVGDDELAVAYLGELLSAAVVAVDGEPGVLGWDWRHVWLRLVSSVDRWGLLFSIALSFSKVKNYCRSWWSVLFTLIQPPYRGTGQALSHQGRGGGWTVGVGVEDAKAACKPSSVSGLLGRSDGDHLSRPAVADGLERPTRGWAGLPSPPIRPCSGWGLPSLRCYHRSGELLPRLFTLTRLDRRRAPSAGGVFL